MPTPSKFDILIYLHFTGPTIFNNLEDTLRRSILFEDLNVQTLHRRMRELIDSNFVLKKPLSHARMNEYSLNLDSESLNNHLSFLLWCRKEGIDYNTILKPNAEAIIRRVLECRELSRDDMLNAAKVSSKTLTKYTDVLLKNRFIYIIRKKPMVFGFLLNDVTLWYLIMKDMPISNMEYTCKNSIVGMDAIRNAGMSKEMLENLIKLHIYSSTVTEGNTASGEDVERIIHDLPTDLTPKEIIEIKNTKDALDVIVEDSSDAELDLDLIKRIHQILMRGLIDEAGVFFASSSKRIVGSKLKLPSTNVEIEYLMRSLVSCYHLNKNCVHPLILGSVFHFLFVSIHPFKDGNGRAARLMHSFILLKNGYPIFAFDPDRKYDYFSYLEKGRESDISDFVRFIVEEHRNILPSYV